MFEFFVCYVAGRISKLDYIVGIATPEAGVYATAESEEPVDVGGIELEETGYVPVGNPIGTLQTASKNPAFPYKGNRIA